jgi:nucleoside-diphosphate-sugar epimerase
MRIYYVFAEVAGLLRRGEQILMRMFIAGMDGYLGWSLGQHLARRGHGIAGADALYRRSWVREMGSPSAIPIAAIDRRLKALRERSGQEYRSGKATCAITAWWSGFSGSLSLKPLST